MTYAQIADYFASVGKPVSMSCIYKWADRGYFGTATIKGGKKLFVSRLVKKQAEAKESPDARKKLTRDDVHEIRLRAKKESNIALARDFEVSSSTISLIVRGLRWGD